MIKTFQLLKLIVLFTLLSFLSCTDDLYNNHQHNHGENKNKISLSQFKTETKIKDFKTIIKSNIQAMKSTNRTAELSDFVIDTLAIQRHISQNNKTTYSFRIYPLSNVALPSENFNLVYRLENNNWEQSIFSLIKKSNPLPSEEQFESKTLLFDSKTTSTTARAGEMCISEMYYVQCDSSCHGQCDGFACPTGQCIQKTIMIDFCGGSGGASGGGGDPNSGGSSDYSQSGQQPSNPYEFTPNMFDNPVYDDPNYVNAIKAQHFFSNLLFAQQVWANENVDAYNQLIQHQINNNWSDESEAFAKELMDLAIENNATFNFDNTLDPANSLVFNTIQDFENHLETNLAILEETDFEIDTQNQRIATAKLSYGTFGITIKVKQNMLPTYEVVNVSSVKTGLSILLSYEQTDYNVDIVGSYVNVDVYGLATTGIKITVPFEANITFEDEVHFRVVLDKNTGHLITAYEIND